MKKKSKRTLTPKLRFPEFRDGPYHNVRLGDVAEEATERNGKTLDADVVMGVFKGEGMQPMEKRLVANNLSRYKVVEKDCFAYNPMRLNIGSIARWSGDESVLVSPDYIVFRCSNVSNQKIDPNYLDHFRYSDQWDRFVNLSGDGSVRVRIYFRDLATLQLTLPSLSEQQKIAECLSSRDGLIAAEGRMLEALRDHKRGLTQQLFPQPGQTQPRLRFPAFRDNGEWEEKEVGEVFKVTRGEVLAMPLVKNERTEDAPYPVYSSQTKNVGLAGYYSEYLYEDAITWTTDGANAGDVNYRPGKFFCTNVCGVLISDKGFANPCTAALINSVSRQHVSYVGNPKLMNGVMAKIRVAFPLLAEQRKIADCLSALDTQIAAQAEKIDSLKTHKRGLMQQLFPAPEEQ
jgi:type I restriction enzyme S subunit